MNLAHRRAGSTATETTIRPADVHSQSHRLRARSDASPSSLDPSHKRTASGHRSRKEGDELSGSGEEMTSSDDFELDDIASEDDLDDDEETGLTSGERTERRKKKRRNTLLDRRIVPHDPVSHRREKEQEERLAKTTFWWKIIINTTLIAMWYLFSISITLYNKWMFKSEDGEPDIVFPFPLFTTCVHMIMQFSLSSLVLYFFPRFRPRHDAVDAHNARTQSPPQSTKPVMTRWFYLTRIGPCGAATGLDIGLGNMSLRFISMTFYTMCKSSVLGFVLLFAFLFRLETPSVKLFLIIATMTAGVLLMVAGETAFDTLGFILVMTAAASSGFRWSLTQILLIRNPATSNPFSTLFFLAPVMFLTLIIVAVPIEGPLALITAFRALAAAKGWALSAGILLFPGCLAFAMTTSEFALLQRTSVVTLSICGIFKEVLTITAGTVVYQDKLTRMNFAGLALTILTIAAYNYMKVKKMREQAHRDAHIATMASDAAFPHPAEPPAAAGRRTRAASGSARGYVPVPGAAHEEESEEEAAATAAAAEEESDSRRRSNSAGAGPPQGRASMGELIRTSLNLARFGDEAGPGKGPLKNP